MTKTFHILLILLLVSGTAFSQRSVSDTLSDPKLVELANTVKAKYAPDHRTEYFKVSVQQAQPLVIVAESTNKRAVDEFSNLVKQSGIPTTVKTIVLPAEDLGKNSYGIATLSVANNRLTPGHSAEMVTQMTMGTPVDVLKKQRGWYLVRTPDGYISWTEGSGIALLSRDDLNNWYGKNKVIYTSDYGKALSKPSKDGLQISDLVKGDIMELVGKKGKFLQIKFPDGREAFVPETETENYTTWLSTRRPDADHILATAKTMLGLPYLWGGTSVKGVDCSGFTRTSYFLNGIILPRDASQQALVGEKIDIYQADTVNIEKSLKNLKPGDLLFFGYSRAGAIPKVSHTAIYMGDGKFIQSAGMVKISSIVPGQPDYDAHNLLSARRMLNSVGQEGISAIGSNRYYSGK